MKDLDCQPPFAADTLSAREKEGSGPPCRSGDTQTKEKLIASVLRSVNVRRLSLFIAMRSAEELRRPW
jgi:hypothetical protein